MPSIIRATTTSGLQVAPDNSGSLQLQTNGTTTALTIDTSQNVGIGTTTPATALSFPIGTNKFIGQTFSTAHSSGNVGSIGLGISDGGNQAGVFVYNTHNGTYSSQDIRFLTAQGGVSAATERMRIDSSGNVLVNNTATSAYLDGKISAISDASTPALTVKNTLSTQFTASFWNNATTGDNVFVRFITEATPTARGSIDFNRAGTAVRYNTSSDYRLKDNVKDLNNALDKILNLKPRTFTWKETKYQSDGFIAHELQEHFPDAVSGTKDAIDADGNPVYQGIDTSFLVATLTAAIQEMKAIIDEQSARITALESK